MDRNIYEKNYIVSIFYHIITTKHTIYTDLILFIWFYTYA